MANLTEKKEQEPTAAMTKFNLTDLELDEMIKQAMRDQGYTTFINYQGEEEPL